MQGARHQFFTGTRFALDQNVGVGRCHFADLAVQVLHRWARADNADFTVAVVGTGFRRTVGGFAGNRFTAGLYRLSVTQDSCGRLQHFVMVEWLGNVVHRAHFHRVDRRAQAGIAGHDQHRRALGELDQLRARSTRQAQVTDDQVERGNGEAFLCFLH
ncbi:hypothetical protein D3C86_1085560 [compost metagenome]